MAFRTVVVSSHCKLEYSLNYLVFKTIDETKRILLSEISTLIIESTQVAITSTLISELIKNKINVVFCDEKRNPCCQLIDFNSAHNSLKKVNEQIAWSEITKSKVWQSIVKEKINNQAMFLKDKNFEDEYLLLLQFIQETKADDITNREGHAAKVYFNKIYGKDFSRNNEHPYNTYLNYGYTLLLSLFNRMIYSSGYLTQIGIHHKGEFNPFNLSCDFIEPFRILVDKAVEECNDNNFKEVMQNLLIKEFKIDGKNQSLTNAINIYCNSIFSLLNTGEGRIKFLDSYEL